MTDRYDVVVVGGAFSGASTALLLRRWVPGCRVLVVEKLPAFDRKVGEATVEMSGMFLQRVLRFYDHLSREQLPKHGLRYWFPEGPDAGLDEVSEVGPFSISALPSFQLDRSKLDEAILARADLEGVEVARPARVEKIDLGWPESTVLVKDEAETTRSVRCRWVVDASGRHNLLSRKLGLFRRVEEHPTAAVWTRWRRVRDYDDTALAGADPSRPRLKPLAVARRLATNHFCGYGFWIWTIPLAGGETSIGVVYDKRYFDWPTDGRPLERYVDFLASQPGLRELIEGAEPDEADFRAYGHLPYRSSSYMGRGWGLVGDAASFLDPYYSPGLDHASFSIYSTARLIQEELGRNLDDETLDARITEHNLRFERSYGRWLSALYLDKYEILGDAELTAASFLVDTASYYLGVVGPATGNVEEFRNPIFGLPLRRAKYAAAGMDFFRRRMVKLARFRRRVGSYGRKNRNWRVYPRRFQQGWPAVGLLIRGMRIWFAAEAEFLVHRLRKGGVDVDSPVSIVGRLTDPGRS